MNKNKIIMSAIGGVALVAAAVVGWLLWSACDEKSEMESELEVARGNVERANSAKVAPTQESVDAIDANRKMLDAWSAEALAAASAGDRAVDASVTPEAFKRSLVVDARTLAKLPGGSGGTIVKEDFGFGFKDYITGGSMPEKAKLPAMQRQWDEIKLFVQTLSACGAVELLEVSVVEQSAKPEEAQDSRRRNVRRDDDGSAKKLSVSEQSYVLKFLARPAALVGVLNAFATSERFIAVDGCSFARADDTLQSVLGGKDKKDGGRAASRSGRRGRRASEDASKEGEEDVQKKGLVTDPEADMPFTVTLKVTTIDFGTAGAKAAAVSAKAADVGGKDEKEVVE